MSAIWRGYDDLRLWGELTLVWAEFKDFELHTLTLEGAWQPDYNVHLHTSTHTTDTQHKRGRVTLQADYKDTPRHNRVGGALIKVTGCVGCISISILQHGRNSVCVLGWGTPCIEMLCSGIVVIASVRRSSALPAVEQSEGRLQMGFGAMRISVLGPIPIPIPMENLQWRYL